MIKLIELYNQIKENQGLNIPDGKYKGTILGYDVTLDEPKITFKCITGFRNVSPIPCDVEVKNGEAFVDCKGGKTFSSEKAKQQYIKDNNL